MNTRCNIRNAVLAFVILFLSTILLYFQTVTHEWHLDDSANILQNQVLHISNLQFNTVIKTFFAHPTQPDTIFRPISNLTFGLNWFHGQNSPYGYHVVNIIIHFLASVFLYLSCIQLAKTPNIVRSTGRLDAHAVALVATTAWCISPINSQAITYIVQRMAQLATLFSIATILFFILARLASTTKNKSVYYFLAALSAILAFGSKENSVILPFSLLLIEFIFFTEPKYVSKKILNNKKKTLAISLIIAAGITILWSHYGANLFDYGHRSFTMTDRLLTEPRILLFHLSQIFFPTASTLSIEHDIVLSSSLFTPWSTLPAIITCVGLICYGFAQAHKNPILSFSILFFFLNHLIESTVIPLELIFEHRNYLPSLFLFLPIAVWITKQTNNATWLKQSLITLVCVGFLILSGISTHNRNKVWATEQSLWEDAMTKAPRSARAKLNLAKNYIESQKYDEAFQLCVEAEQLVSASQNNSKPISFNSKGAIAYSRGDTEEALTLFNRALNLRSDYTDVSYKKIQLLIELQRYEEALETANELFSRTEAPQLQQIQGSLLLRLNKPTESLATYKKAQQTSSNSLPVFTGKGKAVSMLGHYEEADKILNIAMIKREPDATYLRVENYLAWGKDGRAKDLMQRLLNSTPLQTLLNDLSIDRSGAFEIPFDHQLIKKQLLSLLGGSMYTRH